MTSAPQTAPELDAEAIASDAGARIDTVVRATATPADDQPWGALGLTAGEYARIRQILGRRPTSCELAMYSVMWSEHCSYKSSKVHLRRFGELTQETRTGKLLAGIGENAGVIDVGQGWAVTFKIESHNHPSYVEPHQGAATGIGGIVRDILAMGARPVAVMDSLRFGPLDAPDTARVLPGVVAGIGGYGNCLGLPNVGGEVVFDPSYAANPLVNALCVGVLRHHDLHLARATGTGNRVILYGADTGGDGIGGASILASETFDATKPSKRPAVQVGDPFMEKLLIECTLELFAAGVVTGIQDFGAAGISCATSELAAAGDGGMHVDLDKVPLRDPTLAPEEILMSESQERMMAVVAPGDVERFLSICAKWEVPATDIGEVTDDRRLVIDWRGQTVVDVDPHTVAHEGPVYDRPIARPDWQDRVQADDPAILPRPAAGAELADTLLALAASPNLCDKSWITNQYDRYVRGNSVLAQPHDAGMLRIDEGSGLGVALATDGNARFSYLDPYAGAQLALAEAHRNVAVTGARPLAVSDCLNFGSPEDSAVMWQFRETVAGLVDGCRALGTPVTGGNVSFYNQTGSRPILPTPVVGVLGVIEDVTTRIPSGFRATGDAVVVLGETREELAGSAWAEVVHDHLGGRAPGVDLEHERRLAGVMVSAAEQRLLSGAHDCADGGIAQCLLESSLHHGYGVQVAVPPGTNSFVWLFSESAGRVVVSLPEANLDRLVDLAARARVPLARVGTVEEPGAAARFAVVEQFDLSIAELRAAWRTTIPAALGLA